MTPRSARVWLIGTYPSPHPSPLNPGRLSLGLETLRAWVEAEVTPAPRVRCRVYLDAQLDHLPWLGDMLADPPDVVGFSCAFWNVDAVLRSALTLKREIAPDSFIVLGGTGVSSASHAGALLEAHPAIDAIIRGEGEVPFGRLLDARQRGRPLGEVPSLSYRSATGIQRTPESLPLEDLDRIPAVFTPERESELRRALALGQVSYQTYRGCRQRCSFCAYPRGGLRCFSLERVETELCFILTELRPRYLRLLDAHLGGSRQRALAILSLVAKYNQGTEVQAFHDPRHVDQAYLRAADAAGALSLWSTAEYGVQSASDEVLRGVGRRPEWDTFERAMLELQRYAREHALAAEPTAELMVGLPGETYASFLAGLDRVLRSAVAHVRFFPLLVLPGTELFERASELGVRHSPNGSFRVLSTPTMNALEIQRALHLASFVEMLDRTFPRVFARLRQSTEPLGEVLESAFARYLAGSTDREPNSFDAREVAQVLRGVEPLGSAVDADLDRLTVGGKGG